MPAEGLAFYTEGRRWKGGMFWGVMRENGQSVSAPRFTSIKEFVEGAAVVAENETSDFSFVFGFLDQSGTWRITPRYRTAYSFSEGAAFVKEGADSNLFSLVDTDGRKLIDQFALGGGYLRDGLAQAYAPELKCFGFRDREGRWAIPPSFTGVHDFSEGLAAVTTGLPGKEKVFFIDRHGETVIPPSAYESAEDGFSEGLACVYRPTRKSQETVAGYIDKEGQEVIPGRWGLATAFSEGRAAVMDISTRLWGYIDATGQQVIEPCFGSAGPFRGGLARVRVAKRIGPDDYIDTSGRVVWKAGQCPVEAK
jgi:hypothetical protein